METKDALKDIADIKALMRHATTTVNRNVGWFFVVWGIIWMVGFGVTQRIGDDARFVWPWLNLAGIAASVVLELRFFGKRSSHTVPGLGRRIVLVFLGSALFGTLLALLLDISSSQDITVLILLLTGLCYFFAGIIGPPKILMLGVILWGVAATGRLLLPAYLPLVVAIAGGGALLGVGISFLARRES